VSRPSAAFSTIKVWDLKSKRTLVSFWVDTNALETCAVSPDGLTIVAGDSLGRVHFLRLEGFNSFGICQPPNDKLSGSRER
jgi:WD40 repeat protein